PPVEAVEDARLVAGREPGPAIADLEHDRTITAAHGDTVQAAPVLARVVDQVGQRARDQRRVGDERQSRDRQRQLRGVLPGPLERAARRLARLQRLAWSRPGIPPPAP